MTSIRVLIVDDSAVIRRLLTAVIDSDPAIDVVGVANDGQMGLQRIDELLLTIDLDRLLDVDSVVGALVAVP